ncbi:PEP-CTERM sorting domain-containing protein [Aquabacterium sp. CECT 9606]|uniref:PEP-CTERM sorting domain-containing protein n=1 Tax=Aquabacterium sp. CECT 9606 TaxID=2845822 RepID=UPI001E285490|nr:PEP-CTERM sorting domain-containing protein [Aquabacterium sp. CECT 9606]CAH0349174.1 hypothetical protein AQB9606_00939 [Aquabacterium sp. CECT 9606]
MNMTKSVLMGAALVAAMATQANAADVIPYANAGTYNTATYSFTAATTGDVMAYFVGGAEASYENEMGLLVNGVQTSAGFGLNNHTSVVGQSFNLGSVNAGDTLTLVMKNLTLGAQVYSDPSLNAAYDAVGETAHNHVYSALYTATSPVFGSIPSGIYVGFEDLPFPGADYNYNDESFVFTNVAVAVPEPQAYALLLAGLCVAGVMTRRQSRR